MSIAVHFGRPGVDLAPLVHAAVQEHGHFHDECRDELAKLFERLWPRGVSATMLIYSDLEDQTREEKEHAGLGRSRMPRELWNMLTEKGRRDPRRAIIETTTAVILSVQATRRGRAAGNEGETG